LMKKAHLHEACSMSHPPSTGPIAAVIEVNPDHVPIARPRVCSEKLALIRARLPGISSAPLFLEDPWPESIGGCRVPDHTRLRLKRTAPHPRRTPFGVHTDRPSLRP
jgi:hypothetical protein